MTTRSSIATDASVESVSLAEATRVWAKIGWLGFGGPAGQIALMHRELVEQRRWISDERFLHALSYCMLLPGPEAQQLAIYIGWLMHRTLGGVIAGTLFVLPGVIVIGALSWLYATYQQLPVVTAIFFGLKAAVLAVVVEAVLRVGRRALKNRDDGRDCRCRVRRHLYFFKVPFPLVILGAAADRRRRTALAAGEFSRAGLERDAGRGRLSRRPAHRPWRIDPHDAIAAAIDHRRSSSASCSGSARVVAVWRCSDATACSPSKACSSARRHS